MGKNTTSSGFVGINTGIIENCFSTVKIKSKYSSGFCIKNSGSISKSFSSSKLRKKKSFGFCNDISNVKESFYIKSAQNNKNDDNSDYSIAKRYSDLTEDFYNELNWDIKNTWDVKSDVIPKFNEDNFLYEYTSQRRPVYISNKKQLIDFCNAVNNGDEKSKNAFVVITDDINMKGTKWKPIGIDESVPFSGVFDGNGHVISNFKLCNNDNTYDGFFGVCTDALIINLTLDCKVKSSATVGGFIAVNNNSKIICCGIALSAKVKKNVSAFVAKNNGYIAQCYAVGKVDDGFIILPFWILLGLLLAGSSSYMIFTPKPSQPTNQYFQEIPADPDTSQDDGTPIDGKNADNSVSIEFSQVITAESGTGSADILLRNPKGAYVNQYIVLKLQLTDATLINTIGKTGRTSSEQAKFDNDPSYNRSNARVTIATSGAIPTGSKLSKLTLNSLPDGTVLPAGTYSAVLFFEFYDSATNVKSSVNAQSPVTLVING